MLENLPVRLKESDLAALGVVIDADIDLNARWTSLKNRLADAGYQDIPAKPVLTGTILDSPPGSLLPRVGVWIMPNNQAAGILEDFLRSLVPPASKLFAHVQSSVANIPPGERRFTELAEPKAVLHTWLAWQEDPGKPLGTAITARFLDANVPEVDVLADWLRRLFFA